MLSRQNGFTLLEICLALMIGLLLITLAVPSVARTMAEQKLKHSFESFDAFVQDARMTSIREQREVTLRWSEKDVSIASVGDGVRRFSFAKGDTYALERTAALISNAPQAWTFWKSGLCEPALISFHGRGGTWKVRYDPLTARGVFLESQEE